MCFGSKDERNDDPAPKPVAQNVPLQDQSSSSAPKKSSPPAFLNRHSNEGPSSSSAAQGYAPPSGPPPSQQKHDFAPPSGPPPGVGGSYHHRDGDFAPPSGPPPGQHGDYGPPSGPPPSGQQHDDYGPPPGPPPSGQQHDDYAPPPGPPPPGQQRDEYAPPPGPPPPAGQSYDYAPPPGPPPSGNQGDYAPPPGPPPQANDWAAIPPSGPPPGMDGPSKKHDWEDVVPDTSLFPPPPAIFSGFERSPTSNATEEEAEAGEQWCRQYPLSLPGRLDVAALDALRKNNVRLMEPTGFSGKLNYVDQGRWHVQTIRNAPDRCIISYPPLYSVAEHDPTRTGVARTIYYEVRVLPGRASPPTVAMGFSALPYPSFRMPGWHRGSLAVHGDDGHKFINDRWGGKSFTQAFRPGETYGIGMTFKPSPAGGVKPQVDVFFTRNGVFADGWDLHEETDANEDLPVTGLEGFHDLCCTVGTYDETNFEVIFEPSQWLYKSL